MRLYERGRTIDHEEHEVSKVNRLLKNHSESFDQAQDERVGPWNDLRKSVHADPSTGSGLKAVEGVCPEAPRRVEAFFILFQQL